MKLKAAVGLVALFAVPMTGYATGCSSSTSTSIPDGRSSSSSGASSSGSTSGSTSGSSSGTSGSGSTSGSSSGTSGSGSTSGSSSGSTSGGCTAATTVPSNEIPAYQPVMQVLNACSATQISGFLMACTGATGTMSACTAFSSDTANAGCKACLLPATDAGAAANTGGIISDYAGTPTLINQAGCIALEDTTSGPACAAALEPVSQCEFQACNTTACQMATQSVAAACQTAADMGACSSQYSAFMSACATDLAGDAGAGPKCANLTQILNAICGTGMN